MPGEVVLLVDDEDSIRVCVKAVLVNKGFHVLESANGEDALALVRRLNGSIETLVTDIRMPGMDGFQLAEAVAAMYPAIPVVFISGTCTEAEMEIHHHPERGRAFVGKPFSTEVLLTAMKSVMDACDTCS